MGVTVAGWRTAEGFAVQHPDALPALERWLGIVRGASWRNLVEVRALFPHADAVGPLTVFNIRGNRYRLIARIEYRWQVVLIKGVLMHEEYDKGEWKQWAP